MYKQLFRQKLKTILGVFLTALAVTGLCVGVGQSMAAAQTAEALQNQFTTAAFPTNAFLWLDNPEKVGWWRSMDMAMPQEVVDWMENTARNHPGGAAQKRSTPTCPFSAVSTMMFFISRRV